MSKLKKTFKAIQAILKNPWLLNHVLADDTVWKDYLLKNHQVENGLAQIDLAHFYQKETLECFAFLDGGSLPTDIALLKALSKRFENCRYFEIGTWRGESVINVAENAQQCYTLNLSKEEMLSLGMGERYADLHGFFSKSKKNIEHLEGNSMTYDFAALNQKFDLIFIDGNHHYEFVKNDTAKIFEHLIHEQTIVVWHDYAYNPEKPRPEVFAGILDGTPPEFRKHLYQVSNTMCAIFIREKVPTKTLDAPSTPNKTFRVSVERVSI